MAETASGEPRPLAEAAPFEEGDFHGLAPERAGDREQDERRLRARRKLAALAKEVVAGAKREGLALESRTSLHHPHAFNGMRVTRLWAYVTRSKAEKTRLRGVLGRELARDLDSAHRNAYLCLALEHDALEVSLRIHPEGWYDGQNLVKRVAAEGVHGWLAELNRLAGFELRLHDWKGEWRCGGLEPEQLEEFLRFYTPGDHRLAVQRRWPAPPGARGPALSPEAPAELVREALRLLPLYRFTAWSGESDFLFAR